MSDYYETLIKDLSDLRDRVNDSDKKIISAAIGAIVLGNATKPTPVYQEFKKIPGYGYALTTAY